MNSWIAPVLVLQCLLILCVGAHAWAANYKLTLCLKRFNDVLGDAASTRSQTTYNAQRLGKELLEIRRLLEQVPKSGDNQAAEKCLKEIHELTIRHYLTPGGEHGEVPTM